MEGEIMAKEAQIVPAEFSIDEVFDYFAKDLKAPKGYTISRVTPHYDPRRGQVIFLCYCEPIELTIPADQSYPAASFSESDL
jgi:hypothetical protein